MNFQRVQFFTDVPEMMPLQMCFTPSSSQVELTHIRLDNAQEYSLH